jgi:hypothetical protein
MRTRRTAITERAGKFEVQRGIPKSGAAMAWRVITATAVVCILPVLAAQAAGLGALEIQPDGHGGQSFSVPVQILLLMAGFVFLPAILLTMTAFTRIIIVLSLLPSGFGADTDAPKSNSDRIGFVLDHVRNGPGLLTDWQRRVAAAVG